jgi:hypothetical protein
MDGTTMFKEIVVQLSGPCGQGNEPLPSIKGLIIYVSILLHQYIQYIFPSVIQALGPTLTPIQWVPGVVSTWVKRPGREADHSF